MRTSRFLLIALAAVAVAASSAACIVSAGAPTAPAQTLAANRPPAPAASSTPAPAPSSTPSSTPAPASSSASTLLPIPHGDSTPGSALQAGARYVSTDPFPIRLSFVAPPGWAGNIGGPYAVWTGPAANGNSLSFQLDPAVYTDPCHPEQGTVISAGATAGDLVRALTSRPGLARTTPVSSTFAGFPATSIRLTLGGPTIRDCSNGTYLLWELPLGATNELQPAMSERVRVVDVAGQALVVEADDTGGRAVQQQIQQALDSIRFETGG